MKTVNFLIAYGTVLIICTGSLGQAAGNKISNPVSIINDMNWLEGNWQGEFEGHEFEAYYTKPRGGVIISVSKELDSDSSCFFEFEKFEAIGDSVYMTPYPNGKQSNPFALIEYNAEARSAVFENKLHDFPTRFVYHLVAQDSLKITVIGTNDGKNIELKINLRRQH